MCRCRNSWRVCICVHCGTTYIAYWWTCMNTWRGGIRMCGRVRRCTNIRISRVFRWVNVVSMTLVHCFPPCVSRCFCKEKLMVSVPQLVNSVERTIVRWDYKTYTDVSWRRRIRDCELWGNTYQIIFKFWKRSENEIFCTHNTANSFCENGSKRFKSTRWFDGTAHANDITWNTCCVRFVYSKIVLTNR